MEERVFGILRNYQGTAEYRYLYTGEELVRLENECHKTFGIQNKGFFGDKPDLIKIDNLDGMWNSFWSNDTYTVTELKSDDEIVGFLTEGTEGICDYEDPPLGALAYTWSTLDDTCMYTGEPARTTAKYVKKFGIDVKDTSFRDPRYYILVDAGMPEEDFDIDWPDDDAYRYRAVYETLENGTYDKLVEEIRRTK